jgi:hypothetical protein
MRGIAVELNWRKVQTPRGGAWHPQLVKRVVQRLVDQQDSPTRAARRIPPP